MPYGSTAGRVTRRCAAGACALWLVLAAGAAAAQTGLISREEALAAVFPGATIDADRIFLTDAQVERVAAVSRTDVLSKIYARYVARRGGAVVGRAYVDTHIVRTKRASLLISVEADGRVRRIDVTAFLEPPEYIPSEPWRRQYYDQPLSDDIALQRRIRPIAGATLTTGSVNGAVRRVLALDQVLQADAAGRGAGGAAP